MKEETAISSAVARLDGEDGARSLWFADEDGGWIKNREGTPLDPVPMVGGALVEKPREGKGKLHVFKDHTTSSKNKPRSNEDHYRSSVTTITRGTTIEALFEDQVQNYRQHQRRRYNAQRRLQRVSQRITGRSYNQSLEQQLDPQAQLRLSMQERAAIVPAEVLYHSRQDDTHHRVYTHHSEEALLVTTNQVDRPFIQPESFNQLQRSGMRFIHMGGIQVAGRSGYLRNNGNGLNTRKSTALIQARNDHHDDEDEERAHTIAVLLKDDEEDVLYVKCLTSTVVLSQRKTEGAAGYDLVVNQGYHIQPYGQAMLNTGISIKGTYARIAPRSSYAMRGMIIGGGVVDPDYRGEIKILIYNYSDDDMDFAEGESIAQLILECCKTPPIIQVHDLDKTKRHDKGFGSTSQRYPCTSERANPLCDGCPNCDDGEGSATPYKYYVAPHPDYIDDREYIEYQPPKSKAAIQHTNDGECHEIQACIQARRALISEETLNEPE
ncbi:hypothetical protein ZIOFF_025176 [Zingiber officinale]|uniref:dUTP diphosphatase n=1 Tax=Zingiber officinale TaxID=94328 RepID=A0A8J5LJM6_ZINOF|nr:hypothetical protein ZIOFF_025176 [Zingiber officinale]